MKRTHKTSQNMPILKSKRKSNLGGLNSHQRNSIWLASLAHSWPTKLRHRQRKAIDWTFFFFFLCVGVFGVLRDATTTKLNKIMISLVCCEQAFIRSISSRCGDGSEHEATNMADICGWQTVDSRFGDGASSAPTNTHTHAHSLAYENLREIKTKRRNQMNSGHMCAYQFPTHVSIVTTLPIIVKRKKEMRVQ